MLHLCLLPFVILIAQKGSFSEHVLKFAFPIALSKTLTASSFTLQTVRRCHLGTDEESTFFHPDTVNLFRGMFPDLNCFSRNWTRDSEGMMKSAEFRPIQVTDNMHTFICPPVRLFLSFVPGYYPKERSFLAPIITQIQNLEWFGDPRGGTSVRG